VSAPRTRETSGVHVERRLPRFDDGTAPRARGQLRSEPGGAERSQLQRPQARARRASAGEPVEELGEQREQVVGRLGRARQLVRELGGVTRVRDAMQIVPQSRVRLDDGRLAQHP